MFQVKQSESTASRKRLPILLVDLTDGYTGETGVTSPTINISKNGATAASGTGSFVEIGSGQYYYEFASGEIDTLGWISVFVEKSGVTRAYNAVVQIMAYDYANATNLGLSALPTAAIGATGALLTSYTSNGSLDLSSTGAVANVANVASGLSDADAAGLRYRLGLDGTATAPSATGNLGANAGSIGGVAGNIVGNLLGTVTGDVQGNVDGTVNAVTFLNGTALAQIWDWDTASIGATSSIGFQIKTNLDEQVSLVDGNVWNYDISGIGATNLAGGQLNASATPSGTGSSTAVEIAQEVWNYDLSSYISSTGVAGERLQQVPLYVWQFDIDSAALDAWQAGRKLQETTNAVYDFNLPGQIIGQNVWNYDVFTQSSPGSYAGGYLLDISTWSYGAYNKPDETTIANAVWSYDTTGIPAGPPYTAGLMVGAATGASVAEIANQVWSTDVSGYTSPSAGYDLTQAATPGTGGSSAVEVATEVWAYATRDITGGVIDTNNDKTGYSLTQSFPANFDILSINGSGEVTTSNPGTGSSTTAEIAAAVWNYSIPTDPVGTLYTAQYVLGDMVLASLDNITSQTLGISTQVWDAQLADIGGGNVFLPAAAGYYLYNTAAGISNTSAQTIAQSVWNYNTGTGASAATQLNAAAVAGSGGSSALEVATEVWGYATRDITGGVIDTNNDKTGYSLTQSFPANFDILSINGSGEVTTSNPGTGGSSYTPQQIAVAVWEENVVGVGNTTSAAVYLTNTLFTAGNIETYVSNQTPQDVWTYSGLEGRTITGGTGVTLATALPTNFSLLDINASGEVTTSNPGTGSSTTAEIATAVWGYVTRDITGGVIDTNNDKTGYSLTQSFPANFDILSINGSGEVVASNAGSGGSSASDIAQAVWTYNNGRSITSGIGVTLSPGQVPANFTVMSIDGSGKVSLQSADISAIQSGLSTLTAAQVGTEVDASLADVGLTTTVTGRIDAAISSRLAASSAPANFSVLSINGSGQVTTSNPGTGSSTPAEIASAVWSAGTRTITGGTGVTLATALPTNFSLLSINGSGQVTTSNPGTGSSTPAEIATAVWNAGTRTITGGTITTNSDKTGYSLTQAFPSNFSTLSINGSGYVTTANPGTGSSTPDQIAAAVWGTNISGYVSPSAGYDLSNVNAGSGGSSASEIASAVWSAGTRTITGGTGVTLATALPSNFSSLDIDGSGKVSVQSTDITTIKSGLSTLTQAQVGTEVDSSLSDVGLTTTVTGRIDAAVSSRLASASAPANFADMSITPTTGYVSIGQTVPSAAAISTAVWTTSRAAIGPSSGQFGYFLDARVSQAGGGSVTTVQLGPFDLRASDGVNGYLDVLVNDERTIAVAITDDNGNPIPLDSANTHNVLVYDANSTLVATYAATVEYEAGGAASFFLDTTVTDTAGTYKCVFDIDNGSYVSKYGGLTILVKLC